MKILPLRRYRTYRIRRGPDKGLRVRVERPKDRTILILTWQEERNIGGMRPKWKQHIRRRYSQGPVQIVFDLLKSRMTYYFELPDGTLTDNVNLLALGVRRTPFYPWFETPVDEMIYLSLIERLAS